ncbi:hypothetical protein Tco_0323842 [Tanacetum coccineum]
MSTLTFADTHNMVAFLEKPAESDGFHEIINFLNANQIRYALTVNPIIYTSCIEQFWATAKENTVNGEHASGIDCFPTATIFEELSRMMKETEVPQDERYHDDSVPIPSNDLLLSGEDRMQLERKKKSRTIGLQRLRKVDESSRVKSSEDKESLGAQEDASKLGRIKIVDETQGRLDDAEMFNIDDLHDDEVIMDMAVGEKQEKSAKIDEREVSTGVENSATIPVTTAAKIDEITPTSAPTTVIDELTLAQTLIEIKATKPKAVTTAATTTTTRPKARGVVVQEPSEFRTTTSSPQALPPSKTKDKGKAIMIESEVPLKKKDQVALDEEMERNLEAQLLLAKRLQTREQEELTDEEKAKLFMEFMKKRRKHFAALRAQEKRNRPPTKTQKRNQISIYLKHMGGYKHNQLKGRSYDEIQKLFDKEIKRVNSFVAMNSEAQEISGKKDESSSKKAEITQDSSAKIAGVITGNLPRNASRVLTEKTCRLTVLVKRAQHGDRRPEDEHERVLWGDLKVMFEPDIKSNLVKLILLRVKTGIYANSSVAANLCLSETAGT